MYELEALKAVQHDLIEYQVALEWALIKYVHMYTYKLYNMCTSF